jgi:hypothetical protein
MILETLLSKAIEVGVGLLADAGFGDEIRLPGADSAGCIS